MRAAIILPIAHASIGKSDEPVPGSEVCKPISPGIEHLLLLGSSHVLVWLAGAFGLRRPPARGPGLTCPCRVSRLSGPGRPACCAFFPSGPQRPDEYDPAHRTDRPRLYGAV